jgi:hypothetical protein
MDNQVRWIVDVDIGYFDTLDHAKQEIVSQRVQDGWSEG